MTKRNLIHKTIPEFIIMFLLFCCITGCSKEDQNNSNINEFLINLADTTNHHLLHEGGYIFIQEYYIIVVNTTGGYAAAESQCPVCGYNIQYSRSEGMWLCVNCRSKWSTGGLAGFNTAKALRVYTITQSGNILSVHLKIQ
jgi:ribosomal protein L37AE/L43A